MAAVALCMSITTAAALSNSSGRWNGWAPYEDHYLNLYEQCWQRFDKECGRNIVDDHYRQKSGKVRPPTEGEVKTASARLDATLHPPEPVAASVSESVAPAPAATTVAPTSGGACGGITPYPGAGSCWAIPYEIVACESGGSYSAYNPSGASGAYQLMVGGGGSPEEQDAAAAKLWAGGAGRSNWVCAG